MEFEYLILFLSLVSVSLSSKISVSDDDFNDGSAEDIDQNNAMLYNSCQENIRNLEETLYCLRNGYKKRLEKELSKDQVSFTPKFVFDLIDEISELISVEKSLNSKINLLENELNSLKIEKEFIESSFKSKLKDKDEEIKDLQEKLKIHSDLLDKEVQLPVEVKNKMTNIYHKSSKTVTVNVACHSIDDARKAALNFGGNNCCDSPIDNPNTSEQRPFPYISLGKDNRNIVAVKFGLKFDYRFYYGKDSNGLNARNNPGCDEPEPFFVEGSPEPKFVDKESTIPFPQRYLDRWNPIKKHMDVYVACKTRKDALEAAKHHGEDLGFNRLDLYQWSDPVQDPNHTSNGFPHFHLGQHISISGQTFKKLETYNRIVYNYHYYFGKNSYGEVARQQPGCDELVPYDGRQMSYKI